jgi:hypothetical protein
VPVGRKAKDLPQRESSAPQRGNTRRRAQSVNIFMTFRRRPGGLHSFFCRASIRTQNTKLYQYLARFGRGRRPASTEIAAVAQADRDKSQRTRHGAGAYTHDTWEILHNPGMIGPSGTRRQGTAAAAEPDGDAAVSTQCSEIGVFSCFLQRRELDYHSQTTPESRI